MTQARRYAENTKVPVERSRMEIERLLKRHGATGFMSGWDDELSTLLFRMSGRTVRFAVEVPQSLDYFTSKRSKEAQAQAAADKEHKRRWRSLLLIIKAKLEIVASGDSSFDREFLSDIMLPDGSTVGEWVVPQLKAVAWEGTMPKMLQGGTP